MTSMNQKPVPIIESDGRRLPEELPVTTTYRRVLAIILAPLVMILCLNAFLAWRLNEATPNISHTIMRQKWQSLQTLSSPVDWLIVGDSSALQGVIPEVLEQSLGGDAINLSTNAGMTLLDDTWMIETYIDRLGPPDNIVVVHTYDVWHRGVGTAAIAKVPLPWGYWQEFSITPDLSTRDKFEIFATRFAPLYAENSTVIDALQKGFGAGETSITRNMSPSGYMRSDAAKPILVQEDARTHIEFTEKHDFAINTDNEAALNKLIEIASQNDIELFVVNGPLYEELLTNAGVRNYLDALRGALTRYTNTSKNVHYISLQPAFGKDQMVNVDHVIHSAAVEYTMLIATEIEKIQNDESAEKSSRKVAKPQSCSRKELSKSMESTLFSFFQCRQ